MRSPALSCLRLRDVVVSRMNGEREQDGDLLLSTCFCDSAGDDVGYDVPWLDHGEQQLTNLPESTHGVQIRLSKCPNAISHRKRIKFSSSAQ